MINANVPHLRQHPNCTRDTGHTDGGEAQPGLAPAVVLGSVGTDTEVQLVRVEGGRTFQHRLAEMGLIPGTRFRVLSGGGGGPFIISIKDARLMLGRGMATRVLVHTI